MGLKVCQAKVMSSEQWIRQTTQEIIKGTTVPNTETCKHNLCTVVGTQAQLPKSNGRLETMQFVTNLYSNPQQLFASQINMATAPRTT